MTDLKRWKEIIRENKERYSLEDAVKTGETGEQGGGSLRFPGEDLYDQVYGPTDEYSVGETTRFGEEGISELEEKVGDDVWYPPIERKSFLQYTLDAIKNLWNGLQKNNYAGIAQAAMGLGIAGIETYTGRSDVLEDPLSLLIFASGLWIGYKGIKRIVEQYKKNNNSNLGGGTYES